MRKLSLTLAILGSLSTTFAFAEYPSNCPKVESIKNFSYTNYQYGKGYASWINNNPNGAIFVKEERDNKQKAELDKTNALNSISKNTIPKVIQTFQGATCEYLGKYNSAGPLAGTLPLVLVNATNALKENISSKDVFWK